MDKEELMLAFNKQKVTMGYDERIQKYFSGEKVDFLPYDLNGIDLGIIDNLGYTTSQVAQNPDLKDEVINIKHSKFGIDDELIGVNIASMMGSKIVSQEHGTSYVEKHVLEDYKDFDEIIVDKDVQEKTFAKVVENAKNLKDRNSNISIRLITNGPWSAAAKVRPIEKMLRDIRKNKKDLIRLLKLVSDTNVSFIKYFTEKMGSARVFMTDPVTCLDLLSLKQFEELSLPYLSEMTDQIYEITGNKLGLHICGHTSLMWDHIANMNISFFGVDNIESMEELKKKVGDRIAISGNVPPLEVFKLGSIDDVIRETKKCIEMSADNPNGYLVDAGCQLPLGVPKENIYAYVYAIRKYGRGAQMGYLPDGLKDS